MATQTSGLTASTGTPTWQSVAQLIDHTVLKPEITADQVRRLCEEAAFYGFASVCVNPAFVAQAAADLRGTAVKICTTIGFPLGATFTSVKRFEAEQALLVGATELDMVQNVGSLRSGNRTAVQREIAVLARLAHDSGAILKVILETSLLNIDEKIVSCEIAVSAGADFVKTSTGFGGGGATVDDIALMRGVVGDRAGVKASGGVRTAADAIAMIEAGANRLGTSAGVAIVRELGAPEFVR